MATATGLAALERELGGPPPDGLDGLDDHQLQHLADLVAAAKAAQVVQLREGADAALRFVPRLLRGPFRKALGM